MLTRLKTPNFPNGPNRAYKVPFEPIPKTRNEPCRQYRCLEVVASTGLYCGLLFKTPAVIEDHDLDIHVGRNLKCHLCHEQRFTYVGAVGLVRHQSQKHSDSVLTRRDEIVEDAVRERRCDYPWCKEAAWNGHSHALLLIAGTRTGTVKLESLS